jgi:beta-glucanase (GH16 family)
VSLPLEKYTLVVDSPTARSAVRGNVPISGRAPGFVNVVIWDAHYNRLAEVAPKPDGSFAANVDASPLAEGDTTWTVDAWDSPPGQPSQHSAQLALALSIQAAATTAGDPGTTYVPAGYHLTFADEFSNGTLDTTKWNTAAPWNVKWYPDSHQLQAFIPESVKLKDGKASLIASHSLGNTDGQPYASGSITSNRTFTYGYFETRVLLPAGKGFWPAYWLTSSVRWPPELDIFEVVDGVDYSYTHTVPGGVFKFIDGAAGSDSAYPLPNPYGVYHVYGFRWTATELYRYVDGLLTEHDTIDAASGSGDPFWLNLSLQVGGDWPGSPDASTPFPAQMDIDYVRVYEQ